MVVHRVGMVIHMHGRATVPHNEPWASRAVAWLSMPGRAIIMQGEPCGAFMVNLGN